MERKRAVAIIVENNQQVILGKKRQDSNSMLQGEWHIPGETLKEGETDFEAIMRGIKEEVGIEVEVVELVDSHETPKGTVVNWYKCRTNNTYLNVGSDLDDARWVAVEEVSNLSGEKAKSMWPDNIKAMFIQK